MLDRDSFAAGNEPVPVCVCSSCGRYLFALLARHWLRRCSSCDIGVVQKTTISNLHWGSWVVQVSPWIGTDFFVAPGWNMGGAPLLKLTLRSGLLGVSYCICSCRERNTAIKDLVCLHKAPDPHDIPQMGCEGKRHQNAETGPRGEWKFLGWTNPILRKISTFKSSNYRRLVSNPNSSVSE